MPRASCPPWPRLCRRPSTAAPRASRCRWKRSAPVAEASPSATRGAADSGALEAALGPLLARVGGEVVHGKSRTGDVPVEWLGEVVFHVRLASDAGEAGATDLSD